MTDSQLAPQSSPTSDRDGPNQPSGRSRQGGSTSSTGGIRHRLVEIGEAYALVGLIGVMFLFFTVYGPTSSLFPTSSNLKILVAQQSVIAVVALAALIPLVAGEWDLSVGANAGMSAVFVASALSTGTAVPIAILIGLAIGLAVGVVNGIVVTGLRVEAVIPTLGMATIITGIVTAKTGGIAVVSNIPTSVTDFGSGSWAGIPRVTVVLAVITALVYYGLNYTPLGRHLYAAGSNRAAAALVGISLRKSLFVSFVAAGLLAGFAGALQVARAGGADPGVGESFTLPALAAAFLSAAAIKPGRYNVGGTLVAIFFLAVLNNGLNLAGAPNYVSDLVNGTALIIGIGLAAVLGRRRAMA